MKQENWFNRKFLSISICWFFVWLGKQFRRKIQHWITMFSSYQPICNIYIMYALCVYYCIWQLTFLIQEGPGLDVYYDYWPTRAGWKNTTETVPFQPRCTGILWNIYYRLDLIVRLYPTSYEWHCVLSPCACWVLFCTLLHPLDGEIQIHPHVEVYLCVVFESAQSRYDWFVTFFTRTVYQVRKHSLYSWPLVMSCIENV